MSFEIVLIAYAVVLAAAAIAVVARMIIGPTILDRAISTDSLVTLVVMGMALYAAQSDAVWAGPAMLGLTGLAFIGTVTFARFVAREEHLQHRGAASRGPSTATGVHEAIHLRGSPSGTGGPDNRFAADGPSPRTTEGEVPGTTEDAAASADVGPGDRARADAAQVIGAEQDTVEDPAHPGEPLEGEEPRPLHEEDSETGFGAQEGSRGFEDEGDVGPDGTEGTR